jgi:hypothetical protein
MLDPISNAVTKCWYLNYRPSRILAEMRQNKGLTIYVLPRESLLRHGTTSTVVSMRQIPHRANFHPVEHEPTWIRSADQSTVWGN